MITPAFAQAAGGNPPPTTELVLQLMPFAIIFVIVYFLVIRPQKKRQKEHETLIKNLRRGDTVITNGGLIGKVTRVVDEVEIEIEIAPNVRARTVRSMISDVRAKGEPVKEQA